MVYNKNAPLLIFPNQFEKFSSWFESLSLKARKDLGKAISDCYDATYKRIDLDVDILREYMKLWESQPLNDGNYPLWGNWTPKYIVELNKDFEVLLFGLFLENKLIAIQFVFKWDKYINCNAPLYDKELYSKMGVAKYMWLRLVEWSILNNIEYLDLMGPEGLTTWKEVIENRNSSGDAGDFGYKWKFIPESIKNSVPEIDYKINSCEKCKTKWIEEVGKEKKCNCKIDKLLIVAHPDDELIFFGNWLKENRLSTKVVCVTGGSDPIRKSEFIKSMEQLEIKEYEIWNYEAKLDLFENGVEIYKSIEKLKSKDIKEVITHSRYGEYGNIQHIELHDIIIRDFPKSMIKVYEIGQKYNPNNILQLCNVYQSQLVGGINEIAISECTGSNWYKHVINNNLIDYGTVVEYNSVVPLRLNVKYPLNTSYWTFVENIFNTISHESVENEPDFTIVFTVKDLRESIGKKEANIIFIFLETIYNNISLEDVIDLIPYTIRTIVTDKNIRDLLGNPLNVVYCNMFDNEYKVIKTIESNILMAREWKKINKIENRFIKHNLNETKLDLHYNGSKINNGIIRLFDNTGKQLVWYSIKLINGLYIYLEIDQNWVGMPILLSVYDDEKLEFSQTIRI